MKETLELLAAAVAFADEGDHDTARRLVDGLDAMRRNGSRKMLLVAMEQAFSSCFIDYAAGLAGRLRYDIVALSIFRKEKGRSSILGFLAGKGDRIGRSVESCAVLKRRAEDLNLQCAYLVSCGKGQTLLEEACRTIRGVEFAVVQRTKQGPVGLDFSLPAYFVEC